MDTNLPVPQHEPIAQPEPTLSPQPLPKPRKKSNWWRILLIIFALYIVGIAIILFTGNIILFPTVSLLGSFMIPIAYVTFFYDRKHLSALTLPSIAMTFLYGGLLGVFAASILEPIFVSNLDFATAFVIGLIEEFVKIIGVLIIARRWGHNSELDGMLLGAAAGMSFAALESMGYGFMALLQSGGSLSATVGVTLLRGLLSPLGHGTWTAILVGVLFRESLCCRFRINWRVIGAFLLVVALHGLWDGLPGVVDTITGSGLDVFISQSVIGLAGLFILWRKWREAVRLQAAQAEQLAEPVLETPAFQA
jgi:RsiW-degrading membrane proteinase PrsW (M82 family)